MESERKSRESLRRSMKSLRKSTEFVRKSRETLRNQWNPKGRQHAQKQQASVEHSLNIRDTKNSTCWGDARKKLTQPLLKLVLKRVTQPLLKPRPLSISSAPHNLWIQMTAPAEIQTNAPEPTPSESAPLKPTASSSFFILHSFLQPYF